jgi:serine/threonine protein kinase/Tfp pilus assembly protein PilF
MTKIAGRYEITDKLGDGGMGVVFRAYDPAPMDREVAVKTLHEFADPLALELFYKECAALKSISHPNIVEIFDIGEYQEEGHRRPFFVMPLLPGTTLDQLIRRESHRLTVDRVVEIFAQTCRGLHAAHEHGLVHRDLKPSNIFVMADDSVKIIDFGVAHAVHAHSRTTGYDKGTLLYMAPEQVQHKPVSVQSDIYALGVTLYEALTRRQPFRAATEDAVIQAILTQIPPPASELNPAVSHIISRVVHKAMAKQPWNRFDSARELGEVLQKAWRNEPIALFDPTRTQPRIQTATKALEKGDYQFAGEIISELEAEGNIDPQITLLRAQIDQVARQKTVAQLLENARARYEEEEDPLALHKLQEVLQLDPTNVTALGLKSKIDDRRSERQIEKWIQLARQHVDNHSYGHAREALQNALGLRPKDVRASRLLKEIETAEQDYVRLRREKTDMYQKAVNAWQNGEVTQALSQMKHVLDLDRQAPDASSPDAARAYQSFYDKVRSEHDAINTAYADARRALGEQNFGKARETCQTFLARYPAHALFQALTFDIDEQQRQRLSAVIADIDRRVEAEADLDAKVSLVREALAEYPHEGHFVRLARLLEDKRDLVNSIVERARVHESLGQIAEAIGDFDTLQTIYASYPGLSFEKERLQKRLHQQARDAAHATWVRQIDAQLSTGDYARASELLDRAEIEFSEDAELSALRKLSQQGAERLLRADELVAEGQALCAQGQFEQGVDLLNIALQLDDRTSVRMTLRDLFVARAQEGTATDWRAAETFADRALELDPNHALARSLRAQALDKKREVEVEQCASQSRRLQAAGDLNAATAEVERGLALYPGDSRLALIAEALQKELGRPAPPPVEPAGSSPGSRPIAPQSAARTSSSASVIVAPSAPPEAVERTRLVIDRRAGQSAPPAPEEMTEVDTTPLLASVATAAPAPVKTQVPQRTRSLTTWIVMAVSLVLAAIIAVVLIQRNRVEPVSPANTTTTKQPEKPTSTESQSTQPTQSTSTTATSTTQDTPATLTFRGLPAGARVVLDNAPIGTIGADGTFTSGGIAAGTHTLQLSARGYDTVTITRDFASGQSVALSIADVTLTRAQSTVDLQADAGTDITITQAGRTIQHQVGPGKISLPEGAYDLAVKGPAGISSSSKISTTAGGATPIDVRNLIVSGMERFDAGGWTQQDGWFTRRGGNFVLYNRNAREGTASFTVRLDRGNPFSGGSRLNWMVGFADSRNYVLLQLDKDDFYRSVIVNSVPQQQVKIPHRIPTNVPYIYLRAQLLGNRLVHEYSTQPNLWQELDAWGTGGVPTTRPRGLLDGQFGFFLPGTQELTISNFYFYPPARP